METESSMSSKQRKLNADKKCPYNQRKWVWQTKPNKKLSRSMSDEGPSRPLKPVECLAKLRSSNEAILNKHKSNCLLKIMKSSTLPVIRQEHSGSEESLEEAESLPSTQGTEVQKGS